jgi:hypothetical protein
MTCSSEYSRFSAWFCLSETSLWTESSKSSELSSLNESRMLDASFCSLSVFWKVLTLTLVRSPGSRVRVLITLPAP